MTQRVEPVMAPLPARNCTRAVCGKPIDPKRVARGSSFCSNGCRNDDKRERRAHHASISCRTCGRRKRGYAGKRISSEGEVVRDGRAAQGEGRQITAAGAKGA